MIAIGVCRTCLGLATAASLSLSGLGGRLPLIEDQRSGGESRLQATTAAGAGGGSPSLVAQEGRGAFAVSADYRYRIVGRVRLLLFWVSSDNVGGARATVRTREDGARALALLIGSDPAKAPRGINEWGYIREEERGEASVAFGVRSITDADSLDEAEARLASGAGPALYGAICSMAGLATAEAWVTSVRARRDVTYRQFGGLLEVLATSRRWERRQTARSESAAPGLLTALERMIHAGTEAVRGGEPWPPRIAPIVYVYKGAEYDLRLQTLERVGQLRTRSRTFRDLVKGEYAIRNRATGHVTRFSVTHGLTDALANVPVHATFQPNWWFKIELQLEEGLDVPRDPADEAAVLARIDQICARASAADRRPPGEQAGAR